MTWFRCGGGGSGIPAALKNRMNAVLNKKFGATVDYPPNGWPDDVNLLGELEEKTAAASSICTFADGADEVPLKNWLVTLPASLSGYTAVSGAKSGKNILNANDNSHTFQVLENYRFNCGTVSLKKGVTYTFSALQEDALTSNTRNSLVIGVNENYIYEYATGTNYHNQSGVHSMQYTPSEDCEAVLLVWVHTPSNAVTYSNFMLEVGSTSTAYEPYTAPEVSEVDLGRTIYGGTVDIVNGQGTDENGNSFTFTPITPTPETALGVNNFWADEGDTEVTYRASGTVTPVIPTLISKTITENGTYSAEDDGADGYDEVTVNVSGGGTIIVDDLIEYPYPNNDNKCIYSSELNTQYAYYAFNPDCGNPYYWSSVGATNQYIGWKFDTAQIVNYYEIWTRNVGNQYDYLQAPKEWKLQGSNDDGITWTDLDAQDFTFTAGGQKWASAVNNTTAYKWYRIFVITAQDTSNDTVIGYIDFKHAYISA